MKVCGRIAIAMILVSVPLPLACHGEAGPTDFQNLMKANATPSQESAEDHLFLGHYGYAIRLPNRYLALPKFQDEQKSIEHVLFFPRGTPEDVLRQWLATPSYPEAQFEQRGLIKLEVIPRNHKMFGRAIADLETFRHIIATALRMQGESFTMHDLEVERPAFEVAISAPVPFIQRVVQGEKVMYLFTSAPSNEVLDHFTGSLQELMPHDDPGS